MNATNTNKKERGAVSSQRKKKQRPLLAVSETRLPELACSPRALRAGDREWRCLQSLRLFLLGELDRLCRLHDLSYFLLYDALLGAIMKKKLPVSAFEPAVGLLYQDYKRLLNLLSEQQSEGGRFYVEFPGSRPDSVRQQARLCCYRAVASPEPALPLGDACQAVGISLYPVYAALRDDAGEARRLRHILLFSDALRRQREHRSSREIENAAAKTLERLQSKPGTGTGAEQGLGTTSDTWRLKCLACLPQLLLQRQVDRWIDSRAPAAEVTAVIYLPFDGLLPATYLDKYLLTPTNRVPLDGKTFQGPAKPHELLNWLYGDYRAEQTGEPSRECVLNFSAFGIDEFYWADVFGAADPTMLFPEIRPAQVNPYAPNANKERKNNIEK